MVRRNEMNEYQKFLLDAGIADTRIPSLYTAISDLHSAVSYMDLENRDRLEKAAPWIMEAVRHFGSKDDYLQKFKRSLEK
jgi:hypothetical protein